MYGQHDRAAHQQAVRDIEIRPSVGFVAKQNPIAHSALPLGAISGRMPHAQSIVQVAKDASRDTAQ